jgi:cytochrome c-type biogenesis protein CcmE
MNRLKVPLVLAVAAAGIAWLVWTGVSSNDVYMSPIDQWDAERAQKERVRVVGWVLEESVVEHEDELLTDFTMRDEDASHTQSMRFRGVLPDLFREGQNVTAAGRLGADGMFHADELMTKCPSKYEGAQEHPAEIPTEKAPTPAVPAAAAPPGPEASATGL